MLLKPPGFLSDRHNMQYFFQFINIKYTGQFFYIVKFLSNYPVGEF